jgi:hypothetical protein
MKNTFAYLFILGFLISSCSSANKKIAPIKAYLKGTIRTNDTIIIIANKINTIYALNLWKERINIDPNLNTQESSVDENPRIYEEKYYDEINEKYRHHDTDSLWLTDSFWQQEDFKTFKVKMITEKKFPKPYLYSEYIDKIPENAVFSFSEPMIYKKTYAVFAISQTTTRQQFINPRSFVIMKKEKNTWIFVKEITDGIYY